MNTCETCRYYMASPLQEPCESCYWDGVIGHDPPNWKGPTNADRIRAMTDEELAEFLWNRDIDIIEKASKATGFTFTVDRKQCLKNVLDWLREEGE